MSVNWRGVLPAITTPFTSELEVDHDFLAEHASWMVDAGCVAMVPGGSLGEGATLRVSEKLDVIRTLVGAHGHRAPVVAGVAALSTADAVDFVKQAEKAGAGGFMVLPPYVYLGDKREMNAHVSAIMRATELPCMLYNNPLAYGTDFAPEEIAALAEQHENLEAVKESTSDVRRVTAIRALIEDRLELLVGVDDLIVEGVAAGATGWIAGLVNAFPRESVALFELARQGRREEAERLYRWFLPLLRLDIGVKFVQMIKLTQELVGRGNARVRPPRLELVGAEAQRVKDVVAQGLAEHSEVEALLATAA